MLHPYATRTGLCAALAAAALAATAAAQVPGDAARVSPATAGKASHAFLDLRLSEDPQAQGENLTSFLLRTVRGGKFDPRAVAELCSDERAKGNDCPGKSKVGDGKVYVTATNALATVQATVDLEAFLAAPDQSGDVRSVVVQYHEPQSGARGIIRGRVVRLASGPFGYELRFDDMSAASRSPVEGTSIKVDRLTSEFGATRTVKKRKYKTVRRNGKLVKVKYYKKIRYDLIKNPPTCDGTWEYQVRVGYPGGRESVRDGTQSCSR